MEKSASDMLEQEIHSLQAKLSKLHSENQNLMREKIRGESEAARKKAMEWKQQALLNYKKNLEDLISQLEMENKNLKK